MWVFCVAAPMSMATVTCELLSRAVAVALMVPEFWISFSVPDSSQMARAASDEIVVKLFVAEAAIVPWLTIWFSVPPCST